MQLASRALRSLARDMQIIQISVTVGVPNNSRPHFFPFPTITLLTFFWLLRHLEEISPSESNSRATLKFSLSRSHFSPLRSS